MPDTQNAAPLSTSLSPAELAALAASIAQSTGVPSDVVYQSLVSGQPEAATPPVEPTPMLEAKPERTLDLDSLRTVLTELITPQLLEPFVAPYQAQLAETHKLLGEALDAYKKLEVVIGGQIKTIDELRSCVDGLKRAHAENVRLVGEQAKQIDTLRKEQEEHARILVEGPSSPDVSARLNELSTKLTQHLSVQGVSPADIERIREDLLPHVRKELEDKVATAKNNEPVKFVFAGIDPDGLEAMIESLLKLKAKLDPDKPKRHPSRKPEGAE